MEEKLFWEFRPHRTNKLFLIPSSQWLSSFTLHMLRKARWDTLARSLLPVHQHCSLPEPKIWLEIQLPTPRLVCLSTCFSYCSLQTESGGFSKVCPAKAVISRREEAPQDGNMEHMAGILWHIANRPALRGPLVSIGIFSTGSSKSDWKWCVWAHQRGWWGSPGGSKKC